MTGKTNKPAMTAPGKSAPEPNAPKTPEQVREEAEKASADAAAIRDGLQVGQQGLRRAADLVQSLEMGHLAKADFEEPYDTALAEAQESVDAALALIPDETADAEAKA